MMPVARCPACGAFLQADDRFCWSCGLGLKAAPLAAPTAEAPPVEELAPEAALALRRAHLAQQRGQLGEAEQLVRSTLRASPDSVPALSMLARVLSAKGDVVGSVAAAQRVSELAAGPASPPGAVARAREDRARIEERVVREIVGPLARVETPIDVFAVPERDRYRSRRTYAALAAVGVTALFLALVAVLRGQLSGYLWFGAGMLAAGWCYHDAETRGLAGLLWAPFVLGLGPFGLAIYLLATH